MTASALRTLIALARAIEQAKDIDDTAAAVVSLKHHVRRCWATLGPMLDGTPIECEHNLRTTTYDGDIAIGLDNGEVRVTNPLRLIEVMEEDFTSAVEELAEAAGVELPREADDDGLPPPHITGNSMTGRRR